MSDNAGEKRYRRIRKVFENEVNAVWIVQDMEENDGGEYHTMIAVKDHGTAKLLIKIWEDGVRKGRNPGGRMSACKEEFSMVYPYKEERPLHRFYESKPRSGGECRQVCTNLLAACISSEEAWPILYQILSQRQVHLEKDLDVSFGYQLNLAKLDPNKGERDCALKCAKMVLDLMQKTPQMEKAVSRKLIQKKLLKDGYLSFAELLRDIHMDAGFLEKENFKERIRIFLQTKMEMIIRLFVLLSVLLGVIAAIMIFSEMAVGDIPLFRIFRGTFDTIGQESLLN